MSETDLAGNAVRQLKINLRLIEALRDYLQPKLSADDMDGFDRIWTPLLNDNLVDSDPKQLGMDAAGRGALAEWGAIRRAEAEIASYVDRVTPQTSAAAVYKLALDAMKIDLKGIPAQAYASTFKAHAKVRAHRVAMDGEGSAAAIRFAKMFPTAGKLRGL